MKAIPYLFYLWLLGMHEVFGAEQTTFFGTEINLAALVVLLLTFYKREMTCLWFGFVAGLFLGAAHPALMGWSATLYAFAGLVGFHLRQRLNLDSMYARLLLILGGTVLINTLSQFIWVNDEFWYVLISSSLPGALYTTLIGWVFFLFKDDYITFAKLKSIF